MAGGPLAHSNALAVPKRQSRTNAEAQILQPIYNLFAGRTKRALGEDLEWWAETFQCDLGPQAACGLVLVALSDHPADLRAGAGGVSELRTLLLERANMLIARSGTKALS